MGKLPLLQILLCLLAVGHAQPQQPRANTPPRGWNSYDSFSWIVTEQEFLDNARFVASKLLSHGYEYVVVDYLWYRKQDPEASFTSPGFDLLDRWGRPVPDPQRWPSSAGGVGFAEVARQVHQMGLKFGIHTMRGISTQAFNSNTLILGSEGLAYQEKGRLWRAQDIGLASRPCSWMPQCFLSVDATIGAGRAFLRSLYQQYADWGVDFVKNDCTFGDDLSVNEIITISEILQGLQRPIIYSLSPGTNASPSMAMQINALVNMYRVTGDDWDSWTDVESHFDVARDFANSGLIGAQGLLGKSWPDLDMLPFGWLTDPGANIGPHRFSNLTHAEQKSQFTLWAMAKSPLMYGGDLRNIDEETLALITNPTALDINAYSTNNKEFPNFFSIQQQHTHMKPKTSQSYFSLNAIRALKLAVKVSNCKNKKTNGWDINLSTKEKNHICWKGQLERINGSKVCFHLRTQTTSTIGPSKFTTKNDPEQYQILAFESGNLCLDSSSNIETTSGQTSHFSLCTQQESQKWELTQDGQLFNRYTGLCASLIGKNDVNSFIGTRTWIASSESGQAYVAFFNLQSSPSTIVSTKEDWLRVLQLLYNNGNIKNLNISSGVNCTLYDVWGQQVIGEIPNSISTPLATHGCALFTVQCT